MTETEERPWWDDPNYPWAHEPTKADYWCLGFMMLSGVVGLLLQPVRAWMLGQGPEMLPWLVALLGSPVGTAGLGSYHATGEYLPFIIPILVGALLRIKFDWVVWWAGKLWGRSLIETQASRSKRAAKTYATAEKWVQKLGWLGFLLAYSPIPLPIGLVVYVLAGIENMNIKKFMILDYISSAVWLFAYFLFGYMVGEPAVDMLKAYAKIADKVVYALVIFIIVSAFWKARKQAKS